MSVKISGFTLVRNGVEFDYPFMESLRSLLPLCDEVVINVGKGTDSTLEQIRSLPHQEKIRIIETEWPLNDPEKKKSGVILSEQTNIALNACKYDWAIYLQADEVLHEDDYSEIKQSIERAHNLGNEIDAIVFQYRHFYGSYSVVQETRSAYRREMRAVRRSSGAQSVGDAQSFLKQDSNGKLTQKLNAILTSARIFHYGWVRTPQSMKEKTQFMDTLYHGDYKQGTGVERNQQEMVPHSGDHYLYKKFWGLKKYKGTHPAVMEKRIKEKNWSWDLDRSPFVFKGKDLGKVVLDLFEQFTGYRPFEFRNYRLK